MGILIKESSGGGGDATAANQQTQINLEYDFFANESVFKDLNGFSVFMDSGKSVADRANQIALLLTNSIVSNPSNTFVTSFTSTTLAGVAALLETFLQANPAISIINISFSSGGVNQHDVLLTYNI